MEWGKPCCSSCPEHCLLNKQDGGFGLRPVRTESEDGNKSASSDSPVALTQC